jgi:hypothetical protein
MTTQRFYIGVGVPGLSNGAECSKIHVQNFAFTTLSLYISYPHRNESGHVHLTSSRLSSSSCLSLSVSRRLVSPEVPIPLSLAFSVKLCGGAALDLMPSSPNSWSWPVVGALPGLLHGAPQPSCLLAACRAVPSKPNPSRTGTGRASRTERHWRSVP